MMKDPFSEEGGAQVPAFRVPRLSILLLRSRGPVDTARDTFDDSAGLRTANRSPWDASQCRFFHLRVGFGSTK